MEACIENYSKGPMVLEYVRFDAASPLSAVSIDIRDVLMTDFTNDDPLGSYIDQLQVPHPILHAKAACCYTRCSLCVLVYIACLLRAQAYKWQMPNMSCNACKACSPAAVNLLASCTAVVPLLLSRWVTGMRHVTVHADNADGQS